MDQHRHFEMPFLCVSNIQYMWEWSQKPAPFKADWVHQFVSWIDQSCDQIQDKVECGVEHLQNINSIFELHHRGSIVVPVVSLSIFPVIKQNKNWRRFCCQWFFFHPVSTSSWINTSYFPCDLAVLLVWTFRMCNNWWSGNRFHVNVIITLSLFLPIFMWVHESSWERAFWSSKRQGMEHSFPLVLRLFACSCISKERNCLFYLRLH